MQQIVFDNQHVVAVDKPADMLTVPGRFGDADPRPVLGRLLEIQLGVRLWPVHRLDREVSGLVVFAKTADAHRIACGLFEGHEIKKVYEAFTEMGKAPPAPMQNICWESRIVRGKKRSFEAPHGQQAITRARVLRQKGDRLHWELQPETGRPHQLRVHLANAGFPIVGDALYGSRLPFEAPGIALRAVALSVKDDAGRTALGLPPELRVAGF